MPYIELSGKRGKGHRALVDEDIKELYGGLSWFLSDTGYAVRRSDRRDDSTKMTIRLHRLIMNAPEGMVVDHLNGDSLDNRRSNLRVCTQDAAFAEVDIMLRDRQRLSRWQRLKQGLREGFRS